MTRKFLLVSAFVLLTGCASQTASIRQLQPAQVNSLPRRLAILDVLGQEQQAPVAQSTLVKRLSEAGFYTLIDEDELQLASRAPLRHDNRDLNVPMALAAARQLGIDALLLTELELTKPNSTQYGSISFRVGDPQVIAKLQYELINARTGAMLDQNVITSDTYQGELRSHGTGNSSQEMVFAGLTRQATNRLAQRLAPHTTEIQVLLAGKSLGRGMNQIHRGNKAAQVGNWDKAADQWTAALEDDSTNHAAWYNLGLAFEAMHQYARARQAFEHALRIHDRSLYRKGLERSEQAAIQYHLAIAQGLRDQADWTPADNRLAQRTALATPAGGVTEGWTTYQTELSAEIVQPNPSRAEPVMDRGRPALPTEALPTQTWGWPSDSQGTSEPATAPNAAIPDLSVRSSDASSENRGASTSVTPQPPAIHPAGAARGSAFIPAAP